MCWVSGVESFVIVDGGFISLLISWFRGLIKYWDLMFYCDIVMISCIDLGGPVSDLVLCLFIGHFVF
jgi:hypothetical protein